MAAGSARYFGVQFYLEDLLGCRVDLVVNLDRVVPEVRDVHFRNPALWSSIGGASTGTNVRRRRLNPQDFLDLGLPLPLMARQQLLAETCAEVRRIKATQTESRKMLDALLPAILDRAFAGAL